MPQPTKSELAEGYTLRVHDAGRAPSPPAAIACPCASLAVLSRRRAGGGCGRAMLHDWLEAAVEEEVVVVVTVRTYSKWTRHGLWATTECGMGYGHPASNGMFGKQSSANLPRIAYCSILCCACKCGAVQHRTTVQYPAQTTVQCSTCTVQYNAGSGRCRGVQGWTDTAIVHRPLSAPFDAKHLPPAQGPGPPCPFCTSFDRDGHTRKRRRQLFFPRARWH